MVVDPITFGLIGLIVVALYVTDSYDEFVQVFVDAACRGWEFVVDVVASRAKHGGMFLIEVGGNVLKFLISAGGELIVTAAVAGFRLTTSTVNTYGPAVLAGIEREAQRAGAFLVGLGDRAVALPPEYGPRLGWWTETHLRLFGEELVALLVKAKETTRKVIRQAVASR